MILGARQGDEEKTFFLGLVARLLHRKMRKRRRRRDADAPPIARHVSGREPRQMNRAKFEPLASVNRHDAHGVEIAGFGRDCAVSGVFIEGLDAPDTVQEAPAVGLAHRGVLAADLEKLVDRDKLLAPGGAVGGQYRPEIVAALEEPCRKKRPGRGFRKPVQLRRRDLRGPRGLPRLSRRFPKAGSGPRRP